MVSVCRYSIKVPLDRLQTLESTAEFALFSAFTRWRVECNASCWLMIRRG
jgi:hypothetical protein